MGRRKIEIRAIKDDRNRSVTFLKRKGGLFKKAHELSVLCSVDVAVIIFGHNKKLYEFSSGDINETLRRYQYYGAPHEHKGPNDFKNKGGDDDEEEEEDEEASIHNDEASIPPQHPLMAQHLQHHNSFHHMRGPGSSSSPPIPNGMFQPRTGTPGPGSIGSRPSSRNTVRTTTTLIPLQHPHMTPPQSQNGFAYAPNPPIYTPPPGIVAPPHPSPQPSQYGQFQQQSHTPQPQHQTLPQNHQPYMPEPQHTPQPAPPRNDSLQPPSQPMPRSSPQPQPQEFRQPEQATPPQIKQLSSKSRSIFTPIDEGGSILAQHFFGGADPPRRDAKKDSPPEIKGPLRTGTAPPPSRPTPPPPPRASKTSPFKPPTRTDTGGSKSGARPKLNLTIPSEASDNEESASPQARSALNSANPARDHPGIVLPPPSPSASALLSAGASGPPNPFARPPPPTSNQNGNGFSDGRNSNNNNNNLETPISALPSRYMDRELLASPGGIFGSSWDNFNSNILPSPNIATPAEARIPGGAWGRTDTDNEKRKADELVASEGKRLKT